MRICQCGGIILQYAVKAGEVWHCDACNRHEVMVKLPGQVVATQDNQKPLASAFTLKLGRVATTESRD